MVGMNRGIGAVPFRFGCKGVDDEAAEESAYGRNDQEQPGMKRLGGIADKVGFSTGRAGMVTRNGIERKVENDLTCRKEDDGSDTGDDADDQ